MIDLLNTVLGDMQEVYYRSWSRVAAVYENPKTKSVSCYNNNNREQTLARDSSSHSVCT